MNNLVDVRILGANQLPGQLEPGEIFVLDDQISKIATSGTEIGAIKTNGPFEVIGREGNHLTVRVKVEGEIWVTKFPINRHCLTF